MEPINRKHDADYISYVESGESAAVFFTRDIAKAVDTKGKWVDVLSTAGMKNENGQWDFSEITVELFNRTTQPVFPVYASDEDKKYITWLTAHKDIASQRKLGKKGIKYLIKPKLVNANKGKFREVEKLWNNTFQRYVPKEWATSSCEIRKCRVPVKPKWEYRILAVRRL